MLELYQSYDSLTGHYFVEITDGFQSWFLHAKRHEDLMQEIGQVINNLFY
jgi:hypothetical protein